MSSKKSSRWCEQELVSFFFNLKIHNQNWEEIKKELVKIGYHRKVSEIKSLYNRNKGYLSLPSAGAQDFVTIIKDYYKAMDEELEDEGDDEDSPDVEKSHSKSKAEDRSAREESLEVKSVLDPEPNILYSMSRDNMRGPYGMDTNNEEEHVFNRKRSININV